MSATQVVVLSVVGFVAAFVALWVFVLWLISWACGWRRLARCFADTSLFRGEITPFASARIGFGNYNGALNIGATDFGIYLATMRVFRPFHPPLLVPWTETEAQVRERRGWSSVRLTFPSVPHASIVLYGRSAVRVLPYLRNAEDA